MPFTRAPNFSTAPGTSLNYRRDGKLSIAGLWGSDFAMEMVQRERNESGSWLVVSRPQDSTRLGRDSEKNFSIGRLTNPSGQKNQFSSECPCEKTPCHRCAQIRPGPGALGLGGVEILDHSGTGRQGNWH